MSKVWTVFLCLLFHISETIRLRLRFDSFIFNAAIFCSCSVRIVTEYEGQFTLHTATAQTFLFMVRSNCKLDAVY